MPILAVEVSEVVLGELERRARSTGRSPEDVAGRLVADGLKPEGAKPSVPAPRLRGEDAAAVARRIRSMTKVALAPDSTEYIRAGRDDP